MPQGNEYSLFLLPTTDPEVNNIIKQLKDGAPEKDGITSLSLKLVSDFIVKPITRTVIILSRSIPQWTKNSIGVSSLQSKRYYNSLILPYIMYFVHVWRSAYETHLRHLMTLQNKIMKLIAGVQPRTNAGALYVKLNILPLKKLYI